MPRDLPLGNGDFLVNFDARYQLRDVFYPNVGLENHTIGEPSRFGIWVDGQFSWSGDDGWQRAINYELETLVGDTTLEHPKLGVRLRCRDAEDGELSRNPVARGSIDSVGMVALAVPAHGSATGVFWIGAGQMYDEVRELDKLVRERTPSSFLARTKDYWRLWANKDESITEHLPDEINGLYKRSTLVIRTQVDNRGAIIAANDSDVLRFNRDTYSYLWPRDGALVADALDLAGYGEVTRRFFFLCGELITREGYLLHKYNPDGSLGSSWHAWSTPDGRLELPIQEDETGLPIWALWQHYDRDRDIEFIRPLYRKLVRTGADFMATYREPRTKLPAPSFDLWEERRGIHAFTTAAVWAGLTAARNFAVAFGQHELAKRYAVAAQEIREA